MARADYRARWLTVCLIILLSCTANAVQLWPDVCVEFSAEDGGVDRGAFVSDDLGWKAGFALEFDLISAELYAGQWLDVEGVDAEGLAGYRLSSEIAEGPVMMAAGVAGDFFESAARAADLERHEFFLSLTAGLRFLGGSSCSWLLYTDIANDFAAYTSIGLDHTVPLTDRVDADISLTAGFGDDRFAESQLARMGAAIDGRRNWSDLSLLVALPVMLGDCDVVPGISYSRVLDDDLRDAIDAAGRKPDVWRFEVAVKLYFE